MPLVSLTVFVPLVGAVLLVLMRPSESRSAHSVGIVASLLSLVGAISIVMRSTGSGFSQLEEIPWIPSLGSAYRVGVDGISLPLILLTTVGTVALHDFAFAAGDTLLLGRESAGVPDFVHRAAAARVVIPLHGNARSLNVALAGAIALAEALRQTGLLPEAAQR